MESNNIIQKLLENKEFIFIDNKYLHHYVKLVIKVKKENRNKIKNLHHSHHILPRSFGGPNTKENLVLFTKREHFIAHWFLIKCTGGKGKAKMVFGLDRLYNDKDNKNKRRCSRAYERNMIEKTKFLSERMRGENNPFYNKKHTEKSLLKISEAGKNRAPFSDETKNKISKAIGGEKNGMWNKQHSDNTKRKMSKAWTPERKKQASERFKAFHKNKKNI